MWCMTTLLVLVFAGSRLKPICALRNSDSSLGGAVQVVTVEHLTGEATPVEEQAGDAIPGEARMDAGTALQLEEIENPMPNENPRKKSGKQKRTEVVDELRSGRSPFDILQSMTEWSPPIFWAVVDYLHAHRRMHEALEVDLFRTARAESRDVCLSVYLL